MHAVHACHSIVFTHFRRKNSAEVALHRAINFHWAEYVLCFFVFCFAQVYFFVLSPWQGQWIQNHSLKRSLSTWSTCNYHALQTPHSSQRSIHYNHSEHGYNIFHKLGPGRRNSRSLLCPYPGYSNFRCSKLSNYFWRHWDQDKTSQYN